MSREQFLDIVGVTNLIPGPNSTQVVIYCGYSHAGFLGSLVAGMSFILPSVILTIISAYPYVRMGKILRLDYILFGVKPAMIAIIVLVSYRLGKRALKSWAIGLIGLFGFIINLAYVILGSCLVGLLLVQI